MPRARALAPLALALALAACSRDRPAGDADVPAGPPRDAAPRSAVVADFVNETGDPVFDLALKHGLIVSLGQSPHVRVTSGDRVVEALRAMNRSADDRVTADLAWEIGRREAIDAVVLGTIAPEGTGYRLSLDVIEVARGETTARARARAEDRAGTLDALSAAALDLRRGLGEPEATLSAFNRSVAALTTASIDALAHYAAGRELSHKGRDALAVPHYCRAVAADPEFRLAHVALDGIDERVRASVQGC